MFYQNADKSESIEQERGSLNDCALSKKDTCESCQLKLR